MNFFCDFLSDEGTSLAKKYETYIFTYLVTSNHFNNDVSLSYLDDYFVVEVVYSKVVGVKISPRKFLNINSYLQPTQQ